MFRVFAFACFLCAAFAWVPPFVDRAGLAALGFGFLALTVGRGFPSPRPSILARLTSLAAPPPAPQTADAIVEQARELAGVDLAS